MTDLAPLTLMDAAASAECIGTVVLAASSALLSADADGLPLPAEIVTQLAMARGGLDQVIADARGGNYQPRLWSRGP